MSCSGRMALLRYETSERRRLVVVDDAAGGVMVPVVCIVSGVLVADAGRKSFVSLDAYIRVNRRN